MTHGAHMVEKSMYLFNTVLSVGICGSFQARVTEISLLGHTGFKLHQKC